MATIVMQYENNECDGLGFCYLNAEITFDSEADVVKFLEAYPDEDWQDCDECVVNCELSELFDDGENGLCGELNARNYAPEWEAEIREEFLKDWNRSEGV
jgi:hypothetical protein